MDAIETYAGRSHDEAYAARKGHPVRAQEPPGGAMAIAEGEADPARGGGLLSARGRAVWQTGPGMDGGGFDDAGADVEPRPRSANEPRA
ncbi:hypothetical protein [Pararobbsia silviterrae]|uniref:Uncharacterized protein n=1 Tax=Pararobbsia silviterrae TaxID=1792498 RepID=A0A494Y340_9BURK|nr:hypothetical protein [Pararobbsia silviterrae]RKP56428.1 hypothetical protein D7S86_08530 [Pararobbsia silviterrae]